MKRTVLVTFLLGISATICYAWPQRSLMGSDTESIPADISISSTTGTALMSANANRKAYALKTNGYAVRITTFATTDNGRGYPIAANSEFKREVQAYRGSLYAISTDTNAKVSVCEDSLVSQ